MAKNSIRRSNYDSVNDILYVHFENDRGESYATSDSPLGFEIMRDMNTDETTGMMIYSARKKQKERQQQVNEMGYDLSVAQLAR